MTLTSEFSASHAPFRNPERMESRAPFQQCHTEEPRRPGCIGCRAQFTPMISTWQPLCRRMAICQGNTAQEISLWPPNRLRQAIQ